MKWDYTEPENLSAPGNGLFVVCEGNFQYGNASLSYYDPASGEVQGEVFQRANGYRLGDVAQSMTVRNGRGWIVVNNSHVIFAIDTSNFKEVGRIENLTSPRYIHFVSDDKAYVTQLWDNRILIVDPRRYAVTGAITVPDMSMESGSTEQMVQFGKYLYVNCWSYQNRILRIDTETDRIVDQLTVGLQPFAMVIDCNRKLWVMTDGGSPSSPYGYEAPQLYRIDAETFKIERVWQLNLGDSPTDLCINGEGDRIYWINDAVWTMDVDSPTLPAQPLIPSRGTIFYGMTVDPRSGEIYIADAIDYQQAGVVFRYSAEGDLLDEFYAGIIPAAFAWK